MKDDVYWMGVALREADKAADRGEVPIGAVLVQGGRVVGRGHNRRERTRDPTAHAEIIAIRKAALKVGNWRLTDATLYVTLEPCLMCMGAILLARLQRVVFGCHDPKAGAAGSLYDLSNDRRLNHRLAVAGGVMETECAERLSRFFSALRSMKQDLKDMSHQVRRDVRVVDGA